MVCSVKERENLVNKYLQDNIDCATMIFVIGPEGGVDSKEIELLVQNGAKCVSLGKRILRTETAPLTLLSMLVYEFEL